MKIRIQSFTLSLFLLMGVVAILLWSVSLFRVNQVQNAKTTRVYQENWQQQLDQLQSQQRLWLQYRFYELSDWISRHDKKQQQSEFINQYYQRYPKIRSIQFNDLQAGVVQSDKAFLQCRDRIKLAATAALDASLPVLFDCHLRAQSVIGLAGGIGQPGQSAELVLLMPYFSFINDFKQLTGKQLMRVVKSEGIASYTEVHSGHGLEQAMDFEFGGQDLLHGNLTIRLPLENFPDLWLKQALWVIPLILLAIFIFYTVFYLAYLGPLVRLTQKMEKVVQAHRPGKANEGKNLAPGLLLLHNYFMHLTHQAKHDPLTGLNNRVIFEERLQQAILEGKRSGRKYALLFVDINQFHNINEKQGQFVGDGLLKQLAKRLTDGLRETDSLARLEKDNFALMLEFTDYDQISLLVDKIYQSLIEPYEVYGRHLKIGVSIGVAIYPEHGQDINELALKADKALHLAQKGDWPVVFEKQDQTKADFSGFSVIQSLRQALNNDEFKMVYQPVVNLKHHNTSYFEALLRWKDDEQHSHSIERTIELAEKNNLIKPLTHWIIESACSQLQHLKNSAVKIAINLSMIDLHDDDLPERIGESLKARGVGPEQLMIEITEGQIMQEPDQVVDILNRLSAMGISLSIDDFGTGQASLTYLKKLPVEKLKIDQSFVTDMVSDEDDSAIVEATIKLAHTLGIEVVAEGVESAEIHDMLSQMDCDYVQGYYISRPIEQDQILAWCDQQEVLSAS